MRGTHGEVPNEMRLYHSRPLILVLWLVMASLAGCAAPTVTQAVIDIQLSADGQTIPLTLAPGSTVQQAVSAAGLQLGSLDRVEPPLYSLLEDDGVVRVVRVTEKFEVEEEEIPFEQQRQPTELLPEGQLQMDAVQKGEPGLNRRLTASSTKMGKKSPGLSLAPRSSNNRCHKSCSSACCP